MKTKALMAAALLLTTGYAATAGAATLTNSQANRVIENAESTIKAQNSTGCAVVVDNDGMLLAFQRLDGATPGCIDAAIGKARTSALYHAPSVKFMQRLQSGETTVLAIPHAVPLGGGYPLTLQGEVVGAVGVSTPKQELDNQASETAAKSLK